VKRILAVGLAVILAAWVVLTLTAFTAMTKSPGQFSGFMAKLPRIAMIAIPFEPLWNEARSGKLAVGSQAPDFDLETAGHDQKVRLSEFRGKRPVVLVFGSYT
jgi:hypothetical protein